MGWHSAKLFLGATNRDPQRWERPDEYDITRRTGSHVGLGFGAQIDGAAIGTFASLMLGTNLNLLLEDADYGVLAQRLEDFTLLRTRCCGPR